MTDSVSIDWSHNGKNDGLAGTGAERGAFLAYGLGFGTGLEWFIPALFFKIVLPHCLREGPY